MQNHLPLNVENNFTNEKTLRELAESDEQLAITLTNDFAFKTAFRNKKAMKGLLSALLELDVEEIQELDFQDPFLKGEFPEEKEGILDVKILLNKDRKINIEIQVLPHLNWHERSLYYLSKHFIEDLGRGEEYGKLAMTVHIGILNFTLNEADGLFSIIELRNRKTHRLYSDKMSLRVLQLKKLKDASETEKQSDIFQWASMISAKDWEVLKSMAEKNEYMQEAVAELEKLNSEKEKRYLYLQREKRIRDEAAIRAYGREEGWEEGHVEGREEGHEEILSVLKLLKAGTPTEEIAHQTNCSIPLIEKIVKEYLL